MINRLKVVLAEQGKTNWWLAEAISKNEATISRWCSDRPQPFIGVLCQIAEVLDVDVKDLLNSTKQHLKDIKRWKESD